MLKGWSRSQGAAGPKVGQDDGHPAGRDQSGTAKSSVWPDPDPTLERKRRTGPVFGSGLMKLQQSVFNLNIY